MAFQMAPKNPAMAFHAFVKKFPLSFRIAFVSKIEIDIIKGIACLVYDTIFQVRQGFSKAFATDDTTL